MRKTVEYQRLKVSKKKTGVSPYWNWLRKRGYAEPVQANPDQIVVEEKTEDPRCHMIIDGIRTLTERQQGIVALWEQGYKDLEVSKILGVTKQVISKQRKAIRKALNKYFKEQEEQKCLVKKQGS